MKKIIDKIKKWGNNNPKKVFYYGFILIVISLIFSAIQYFYFPPKPMTSMIPKLNEKSNEVIDKMEKVENKKSEIISQMKELKIKRDEYRLTKEDSVQAEYLMFKLKELENERTP